MKLLFGFVLRSFPQITSLLYTINEKKNDSIFDLTPQNYKKADAFIIEQLGAL